LEHNLLNPYQKKLINLEKIKHRDVMKMQLKQYRQSNQGFTMVELLVAMVVSLLALGAIYSTFQGQLKSYVMQGETAAMHQNIRAAMFYLQREIRMAGCDPQATAVSALLRLTQLLSPLRKISRALLSESRRSQVRMELLLISMKTSPMP